MSNIANAESTTLNRSVSDVAGRESLSTPTVVAEIDFPTVYQRILEVRPGYVSPQISTSILGRGLVLDGVYYASFRDALDGVELAQSDGTAAGTNVLKDINPGPSGSFPRDFAALGDQILFNADQVGVGRELWRTDGTAAGTQMVKDIVSGPDSGFPENITALGDQALFIVRTAATGEALWRTDGTEAGTQLVKNIDNTAISDFVPFGNQLLFSSSGFQQPKRLWKTDGTVVGTTVIQTFSQSISLSNALVFKGELYFSANDDGTFGTELWKTDGSIEGTQRISDISPGSSDAFPRGFVVLGDSLLFEAGRDTPGDQLLPQPELWKTDGTIAGTRLIASGELISPEASGDQVYFFNRTENDRFGLWKTDGTAAGTQVVNEISPSSTSRSLENSSLFIPVPSPSSLTAANGRIFFTIDDRENGTELWTSDGTEAGTVLVSDLYPGKSFPQVLTKGTPVPPQIPVFPEGNSAAPSNLVVVDNVLYFQANDGTGRKLWQLPLDDFAVAPERDDIVYGTFGDDTIDVGGGWNRVYAGEGRNFVTAGSGDDGIYGGSSTDIFLAGRGRNEISAGDGFNFVITGAGYDRISTGDDNDVVIAGNGFNSIIAGEGNNLVIGGSNGNHVYLGAGDDYVFTGASHDRIYAGAGDNYINAGAGWNTIYTEDGEDTIVLTSGQVFNIIKNFNVNQDQLIYRTVFPQAFSAEDLVVRQIESWGYLTEISTQDGDVLAQLEGIHVTADQLRFSAKPDAVGGTIKQFASGLLSNPSLTNADRDLLQTAGVDRLFDGFPTGPFS